MAGRPVEGRPTSLVWIQGEQLSRLAEALHERQLQIAWLTVEGLSQAEIGEVIGISAEGVRKDLLRMRGHQRRRADDLGIDLRILDHPRGY